MAWPHLSAYSDAVQIPVDAFGDPALRRGVVETNQLGLPRARTGNFACVFKVRSEGRDWAVRCFLRGSADQQERYAAISQHLQGARLPYVVSFEFQPKGIKVNSCWFPILKMEWVDGEPFVTYIERHLNNASALRALASRWVGLLKVLRGQQVAHGDLQHGNILVCGDELRLVDYDGMYVPLLQGRQSVERGHANYQHPNRRHEDFGPYLDNFSAWVIYASILALSVQPSVWHQLDGGDEKLLFREADFKDPVSSSVFQLLENCGEAAVEDVIARIRNMLFLDLVAVPPLEDVVGRIEPQKEQREKWWKEYLHQVVPVRLAPPPPREQVAVAAISVAGGLIGAVTAAPYFSPPAVVGSAVLATALLVLVSCFLRFRRLPELSRKLDTLARLKTVKADLRSIEREIATLREERHRLEGAEKNELAVLSRKQHDIKERERAKLAEVDRELSALLAKLAAQQASLQQQQAEELAKALNKIQEDYLAKALEAYHIADASLRGIGDELRRRLLAQGIKTAADIEEIYVASTGWGRYSHSVAYIRVRGRGPIHVEGIGPNKAQVLKGWREKVEARCRGGMPNSLPGQGQAGIASRFAQEKRWLEGEDARAREVAMRRKDQILSDSTQEQATTAREIHKARESRVVVRTALDQKGRGPEARKLQKDSARSELERKLEAYKNVTFVKFLKIYLGL